MESCLVESEGGMTACEVQVMVAVGLHGIYCTNTLIPKITHLGRQATQVMMASIRPESCSQLPPLRTEQLTPLQLITANANKVCQHYCLPCVPLLIVHYCWVSTIGRVAI